jgi:hypothetical protein
MAIYEGRANTFVLHPSNFHDVRLQMGRSQGPESPLMP